jgi:nucleolar GTP-binding protein
VALHCRELSGYGSLKDSLEAVKELRKMTSAKAKVSIQKAANAESKNEALEELEHAFREIESIWKRDGWVLEQLLDMSRELRDVPVLDDLPTVVLVGSPNVGKSSLVRALSTGRPEICDYPFTTRGMTLGHMLDVETGLPICQMMDTPGLLARPDEERNEMELLTLASMEHISSLVVYVMDLSGLSGDKSTIQAQVNSF